MILDFTRLVERYLVVAIKRKSSNFSYSLLPRILEK